MTDVDTKKTIEPVDVHLDELDFSSLVGNEIVIFSEQLGGQPLKSRVVLVNGRILSVDRTGNAGRIDSLVVNQTVTLRFYYKGEPVAIKGTLKRSPGGNCNIILDERAKPPALRRFSRFVLTVPVKMARLTVGTFDITKIAKLRWLETKTSNLSAGGVLLELSGFMESESYMMLNMSVDDIKFPTLILGQVRYCLKLSKTSYRAGIEFVTKEMSRNRFEPSLLKRLPNVVLDYDEQTRKEVGNSLTNYCNNNS